MLMQSVPALFGVTASPGNDQFTVLLCHFDSQTDGSTTIFDSSPKKHGLASVVGAAHLQISTGLLGSPSSCLFSSSNSRLSFPNSGDWEFGAGDFTVDWWEYRTAAAGCAIARDLPTTYCPWLLNYDIGSGGQIYMSSNGSAWDIAAGNTFGATTLSVWNHFAITRQGNTFRAFKNGALSQSWTSALAFPANANALSIGACQNGGWYSGYIEELRISKGIARWTANFAPPTKPYAPDVAVDLNTKLLLHFDGATGFADSSPYNRGAATANGTVNITGAQKQFGDASAQFSNSNLLFPDSPDWAFPGDFTIDMWVWISAYNTGANSYFITQLSNNNDYNGRWAARINATGQMRFDNVIGGTNYTPNITVTAIPLSTWTHLAWVRSGGNFNYYINGVLDGTSPLTQAIPDIAGSLSIGRIVDGTANSAFYGYLDELRISNIARWTANFTPPAAPYT